jgi:methionyl-tRNA formyltransferase
VSRIRTVFLGTPDFARYCLENLIRDEHFEIVGVVTQPDRPAGRNLKLTPSPVKALVQPLGIPLLAVGSVNTPEALAEIASWRGEAAVVVAFGQILKDDLLNLFPRKIVNVHTSLLPRWRGAAPIQRALMAGDTETGVSLQVLVRKLDAGDVLGVRKLALREEMNAADLHEALKPLAAQLLHESLMDYLRGNLVPQPQDESLVTYAAKIDKAEAKIDWQWPALRIVNLVRGLGLGPAAFCKTGEAMLKIRRARLAKGGQSGPAGRIVGVESGLIIVACGEMAIEVLEVQPESRAKMTVADYLKGYSVKVGDQWA